MHPTLQLVRHPDSVGAPAMRLEVEVAVGGHGHISFRYAATGEIDGLLLPHAAEPARADGLWKHTCFEAFIGAASDGAYYEFNFSPSTQWAAYRFSDYRTGMSNAELAAPTIEIRSDEASYVLEAKLDFGPLDLPREAPWRLGLSAVIEQTDGRKSFWALAHPDGKPDFHHADCFAIRLTPR
jgi:hypothetical protein